MQNLLVSQSCQKYRPTKKIFKLFLMEIIFRKCTKLNRYKWTLVKVTSTKYEKKKILTFASWPRLVNVYMYWNCLFLRLLLTICFVLSFRIPNSCGPITRCQKWMLPCQNALYDVYFTRTSTHPGLLSTSARH